MASSKIRKTRPKPRPKSDTPWDYLDELLKGKRDERKSMVAGLFLMFLGAPLFYAQPPYPLIGVASLAFGIILFISGACAYALRILKKVGIS